MVPFASYVSRGQSKPRLIFSRINGLNVAKTLRDKLHKTFHSVTQSFPLHAVNKFSSHAQLTFAP